MHPILFEIPLPFTDAAIPIYSYGVMLGLSMLAGWYIAMWLAKKDGIPLDKVQGCFFWTAVSAMVGARVLFIITNPDHFDNIIDMLNVRRGGLVAYGGFLGGFLGSWIYMRRARIRLVAWADVVVPTLGSGLGITRWGCLMYGCDYGKPIPEDAPNWLKAIGLRFPNWDVAFPEAAKQAETASSCMAGPIHGSPAYLHHLQMGDKVHGLTHAASALVYPTQLMEVVNGWIIFGLCLLVRRYSKFRGQAFLFFTIYYGITRTLMEMLRGDTQRGGVGELSTSQIVGVGTALAAAMAWVIMARAAKKDPVAAMAITFGSSPVSKPVDRNSSKPRRRK
ncbi:MAG: prolipoprotein diacylglyceryl transferase [Myxococcota bacterium]|nr:prolipoprotein diacylglyceryl transferase [Myxococcota bacterium]